MTFFLPDIGSRCTHIDFVKEIAFHGDDRINFGKIESLFHE